MNINPQQNFHEWFDRHFVAVELGEAADWNAVRAVPFGFNTASIVTAFEQIEDAAVFDRRLDLMYNEAQRALLQYVLPGRKRKYWPTKGWVFSSKQGANVEGTDDRIVLRLQWDAVLEPDSE